ncbi:MAG TPA: GspE/PulE family protein [Opitutaceae bacterium]|nr:GspE/PulE family protein [Opitutaceae bacterium]
MRSSAEKAGRTGRSLAEVLVGDGVLSREALLREISRRCGCRFLSELPDELPAPALAEISADIARSRGVVPLRADADRVDVLGSDPFDVTALDDLAFVLGREVRLIMADPLEVEPLVRRHYGEAEPAPATSPAAAADEAPLTEEEMSPGELETMAGQAPVIQLVNAVLGQAVEEKASDIHFEPFGNEFRIRCRIDGALRERPSPPRHLALPVISRLKVMANLNIAERRLPQDGRIRFSAAGRSVDLRVSTLPTQFGESVVLRILDSAAVQLEIRQLGLPPVAERELRTIIHQPSGLLLVTGPTGSGKTTTLYAGLRDINQPDSKLLTVEDPVEYEVEGIMQVPINPVAGLTFASALRAFLRQDPDVVMVGEIRDLETAQIALQASLTGHLVFSTLHTNDAAGAVTRLLDLGAEPFLVASSLRGVLAQRLVRRICPRCRVACRPSPELLAESRLGPAEIEGREFFHGTGCAHCRQTGYLGRTGLFEWLRVTDSIRELIGVGVSGSELFRRAVEQQGMRTLREEGLRAAFFGETTLDEVVRHT